MAQIFRSVIAGLTVGLGGEAARRWDGPVQPNPKDHVMMSRRNPMLDRGPSVGDQGGSHLQMRGGFSRFSDRLRVLREQRDVRMSNFADIGRG